MKRISLIIIAAVALAFVACGSKQISTRVLCYNVHNCVGLDGELSCERIAKIINDAYADAVAIQELDSMTTRHPGHDMLSELAELTGMHPTFAPSIDYKGHRCALTVHVLSIPNLLLLAKLGLGIPLAIRHLSQKPC